ncbi:MAG: FIG00833378: hypothetical protein, partial [uncultured Pseudonocardia sp.]
GRRHPLGRVPHRGEHDLARAVRLAAHPRRRRGCRGGARPRRHPDRTRGAGRAGQAQGRPHERGRARDGAGGGPDPVAAAPGPGAGRRADRVAAPAHDDRARPAQAL